MGMAASQARYLGLTARKTNVEYEGQQINQARTALSNQSANLWNQMLTLSVPTVPSTTDFTTLQYAYTDGYNTYTISNLAATKYEEDGVEYNAQVTYYYNQESYKAVQARNTNPQVQHFDAVAGAGGTGGEPEYYMLGNTKALRYDPNDIEQKSALEQIVHDFPDVFAGVDITKDDLDIWVYQKNGQTMYARGEDLQKCIESGEDAFKEDEFKISSPIDYQSPLNQYYATTLTQRVEEKDYAILDDASGSGRYSTIKLRSMSETFNLKSEEVTDEVAYNDAMNQYNYDVTQYEKKMADINAKTKIIQEQDRQLELRLKQLDTEQKALSSEMDAVKGIVQKNVESTFKSFS